MKKNILLITGIGIILVLVGGGVAFKLSKKAPPVVQAEPEKKKKVSEPLNAIAEAERPYLTVLPLADGHNIVVKVFSLKKPATEVEYELEYQAGSLLQGAFGAIKIPSTPAEATILLGSCSAGGACTYHEDVRGGTIITRFKGDENYSLKNEWKYIDNKTKETAFSSKDAKFQISSDVFKKTRYLTITNSPGYPGQPPGTVVSEPYALAAGTDLVGTAKVSIRAKETDNLVIVGWDGQSWTEFPTKPAADDAKMATADVKLVSLYLVVKK